jgi:hypothetical protein
MDNLDRLGWFDAFAVTGFGARIGVRVSDPALASRLAVRLPFGARLSPPGRVDSIISVSLGGAGPRRGVRNFSLVYCDHVRMARTHDPETALESFDSWLRVSLALHARRRAFVHGGAVAWRGRAIVLPGSTMAGKTELVGALVRAGAEYLSDEYAVLDEAGRVRPFAKPLSFRDADYRQTDVPVEDLGGQVAKGPIPVGLVLMTRYQPGARWRPRRLSAAAGALAMLANTVSIRMRPQFATRALAAAAIHAPVFETARPDVSEAASAILALAERAARLPPRNEVVPHG